MKTRKYAENNKNNLCGAALSRENLRRANLYQANLSRADLSEANLYQANLYQADLYGADLRGANLSWVNLRGADLSRADLSRANLSRANLSEANLSEANLSWVNLRGADLSEANLSWVNLRGADLRGADLYRADLSWANISDTCLGPMRPPNGDVKGFELIDGGNWAVGYRTGGSPHLGGPGYQTGESYAAPVFSTSDTECHPGLFVCPSVEAARKWGSDIIKVIFRPWDCHKAGAKHRVREFIVWEKVRT
jgi:hypothetical protein